MKEKSQVLDRMKEFPIHWCNTFNLQIKWMKTDNGGEFCSKKMEKLFLDNGIEHLKKVAFTPEQNGFIERHNRTTVGLARSMIHEYHLPLKLWAESVNTAVYIFHRLPNKTLDDLTPFEKVFKFKPSYKNLRIFGSEVYSQIPKVYRKKFDSKSTEGFFVGYDDKKNAIRIWDGFDRIHIQRDFISADSSGQQEKSITEIPVDQNSNESCEETEAATRRYNW